MRVNVTATTGYVEGINQTNFEVIAYVHDDRGLVGRAVLYTSTEYAQQPGEDMNLNLWATSILRGLAARLEETFVYVDQRPPVVLTKHAIERLNDLRVAYRLNLQEPARIDPARTPHVSPGWVFSLPSACHRE